MNQKKDDALAPEETAAPPAPEASSVPPRPQKPVIIYILALFIVAFLLMALSLLMHQRSNEEALGELKDSISAMREAQTGQDQLIQLQEELEETKDALAEAENAVQTAWDQISHADYLLSQTQEAMDWFWQLDEAYALGATQQCEEILAKMNQNTENPLSEYLSGKAADRYAEILADLQEP